MTTGSLEEDEWINLRENLTVPCVLEALSITVNDEGRLANTDVEDFSKVTNFQLDGKYFKLYFSAFLNENEIFHFHLNLSKRY